MSKKNVIIAISSALLVGVGVFVVFDRIDTLPDTGVAQVQGARADRDTVQRSVVSEKPVSPDSEGLNAEEIATRFTVCMRENGWGIPDPVLNADGTVDVSALRKSISQDPKYNSQTPSTEGALGKCLPLLEGATFSRRPAREDEIELEEKVLEFAECVRAKGIDIPDPDFSAGARSSMRPLIAKILGGADSRKQAVLTECRSAVFGTNPNTRGR